MSYSRRQLRQRNKREDKKNTSFFTHANKGTVQTKKESPFFQAKLDVNEPGDKFEQEADTVANHVANNSQGPTSGGAPGVQRKQINKIQRLASDKKEEKLGTNEERMKRDKEIQTKPEEEMMAGAEEKQEEEKKVQMKTQEEEKDEMKGGAVAQRKAEAGASAGPSRGLSTRIEQSSGKGKTLPPQTLNDMRASIGHDFSEVNIHTDNESADMNKELGAQAFTHGKDVFFNKGKYDPDSTEGKKLLAHELTHVVQQSPSSENKSAT